MESERDYDYDLVVIGSGPAGQKAAIQAAKLGKLAAVVDRPRWIGGVCTNTGTIPSKTPPNAFVTTFNVFRVVFQVVGHFTKGGASLTDSPRSPSGYGRSGRRHERRSAGLATASPSATRHCKPLASVL